MSIPDYTFDPPTPEMGRFTQLLNEFAKAVADFSRSRNESLVNGATAPIRQVTGGTALSAGERELIVWSVQDSDVRLNDPSECSGAVVVVVRNDALLPTGGITVQNADGSSTDVSSTIGTADNCVVVVSDGYSWKQVSGSN